MEGRKVRKSKSFTLNTKKLQRETIAALRRSNSLTDLDKLISQSTKDNAEPRQQSKPRRKSKSSTAIFRRQLALVCNVANIAIALALVQLGVALTWYNKSLGDTVGRAPQVIFSTVIYAIFGGHGVYIIVRHLTKVKLHRVIFYILMVLSISSAIFIIVNEVRLLVLQPYSELPLKVIGIMAICLSSLNLFLTVFAVYYTLRKRSPHKKSSYKHKRQRSALSSLTSMSKIQLLNLLLGITQIILGLCICQLGVVGMLFRKFMNLEPTRLFSVVFLSTIFIAIGSWNLLTMRKKNSNPTLKQHVVKLASWIIAAVSALVMVIMTTIETSLDIFPGLELIFAFDYMIIVLSACEVLAASVGLGVTIYTLRQRNSPTDAEE